MSLDNIEIELDVCNETAPCTHYVTIKNNDGTVSPSQMSGPEIYKLYIKNNIEVPAHFKKYADYKPFTLPF